MPPACQSVPVSVTVAPESYSSSLLSRVGVPVGAGGGGAGAVTVNVELAVPDGPVAVTENAPATSRRSKESETVPSGAAVSSASWDQGSSWSSSTGPGRPRRPASLRPRARRHRPARSRNCHWRSTAGQRQRRLLRRPVLQQRTSLERRAPCTPTCAARAELSYPPYPLPPYSAARGLPVPHV